MEDDYDKVDIHIDANGCLTERVKRSSVEFQVHYDDIPESDITTVKGLRCTTPLRTVIDIAPDVSGAELERLIRECLDRRLFTVEEARARIEQPDISSRRCAQLFGQSLTRAIAR